MEADQENQLEQTKAQGEAQEKAANAQAKAEIDKGKAQIENEIKLEAIKTDGKSQILAQEAAIKEKLMRLEFEYNMQLKQTEVAGKKKVAETSEDRKDKRSKMQASQQSEMIEQRQTGGASKNFESRGNDTLGGVSLGQFGPR